jgi:hypothetical protein
MISTEVSALRWAWLYWLVPLLILAASVYWGWNWLIKAASAIVAFSGAIHHLNDRFRLEQYEERVKELEEKAEL